jgi:hypothetical protein
MTTLDMLVFQKYFFLVKPELDSPPSFAKTEEGKAIRDVFTNFVNCMCFSLFAIPLFCFIWFVVSDPLCPFSFSC